MRRVLALAVAIAPFPLCAPAAASVDVAESAARPVLRVDARGNAEISWTARGVRRTLLVPPRGRVLPGGRLRGRDVSRPVGAPYIPFRRALRRTPDGRLWGLQSWRLSPTSPPTLRFSRWRGEPTRLELTLAPSETGEERLEGRASYHGQPVTGFSRTTAGRRMRIYVYLECFGCAGRSWSRLLGIAPRADGSFATLVRPNWQAPRYRALLVGPNRGTTYMPDAVATVTR